MEVDSNRYAKGLSPKIEKKATGKGRIKKMAREKNDANEKNIISQSPRSGKKKDWETLRLLQKLKERIRNVCVGSLTTTVQIFLMKQQWLRGSTVENNEDFRVELPRAWEPSDSSRVV